MYTIHSVILVQFNNVDKLQFWYNNLPAGRDVKCVIGTVKALADGADNSY